MVHAHSHSHHHNHAAPPKDAGGVFLWGIALNSAFILTEILFGLQSNSLALLADAGHNAGDVLGLILSWGAVLLARRKPSSRYTYGLQSSTIFASLVNAVLLLVMCGGIGWEAVQRFFTPQSTSSGTVMMVAAAGVVVNGVTAWLFHRENENDLNRRSAFLHMAADAVVSLGVVLSGLVTMLTQWLWIDPVVSLILAFVIVISTGGLLKEALILSLHAVPKHMDTEKVREALLNLPEIREVHDLHIWAMSTTETALSAHLLMPDGHPGDAFLYDLAHRLAHDFSIGHSTIQIEIGDTAGQCELAPVDVV